MGAHPDYNEEEEELKFFRRKRLGVIKNVLAASLAGTLTYGVYLGMVLLLLRDPQCALGGSGWVVTGSGPPSSPQACCRCS